MNGRVTDHALFSYLVLARFKLRLDKAYHLALRLQKRADRAQNETERNEAQIGNSNVHLLRDLFMRNIADIRPLHADDVRIGAEAPGKLTVADIDGIDLGRTALQQNVRESAGGSAAVDAHGVFHIDGKHTQRLFELPPAAADIRQRFTPHLHSGVLRYGGAGLCLLLAVHIDAARHDIRLGTLAALGEAFIKNKLIKPDLFHAVSPLLRRQCHPHPDAGSAAAHGPKRA